MKNDNSKKNKLVIYPSEGSDHADCVDRHWLECVLEGMRDMTEKELEKDYETNGRYNSMRPSTMCLEGRLNTIQELLNMLEVNEMNNSSKKNKKSSIKVECMECGKKFSAHGFEPHCPKCGSYDIDIACNIDINHK